MSIDEAMSVPHSLTPSNFYLTAQYAVKTPQNALQHLLFSRRLFWDRIVSASTELAQYDVINGREQTAVLLRLQ
jgi:hypothetical protein